MRTYERTHPWLTFRLDLRQASHTVWMLLGEAQSKATYVAGVPLLPKVQEHLTQLYLAKGVLATTAIEGNTLSENEALRRVQGELDLPPSKEYLGTEIDNIVQACQEIAERMLSGGSPQLTVDDIKRYNSIVLQRLHSPAEVHPGELRDHSVEVGRYRGAPAEDCEYLLEQLCMWLNESFDAPAGYEIAFGILKAITAHLYLAWIHPFGDGNGRTARLVEFHIMLSVGIPATAAHLLSNHYNQTRAEYYRQLDATHRSGGNILPFIEFALRGFVDGLKEQIEEIRTQQLEVHLVNYIHESFRGKDSSSMNRRRRLAIALAEQEQPVPIVQVRHITPTLAEAYAGMAEKTIRRDIAFLEQMGLLERGDEGVRIRREIMLAYLPPVRGDE